MTRACRQAYHRLMRLRGVVTVLVAAAAFSPVPTAWAGQTKIYAPPGRAGTSEYAEVVPSDQGNGLPPAMGGGNRTTAQIKRLGSGGTGAEKLAKLGKQGAAAARFAEQTAPNVVESAHGLGAGTGPGPGVRNLGAGSGGSAFSAIAHMLGGADAGGIGAFLPWLLALGAAGAVGYLFGRRLRPRGL
jgi:hypothetical protein